MERFGFRSLLGKGKSQYQLRLKGFIYLNLQVSKIFGKDRLLAQGRAVR